MSFSYGEDAMKMRKENRNPLQAMALMSAILSQLVGSILIGIFSGKWLDKQWGTEPIFLIIGLFIGLAAGIYAMFVSIRHFFSGD
jgi:ATP synthase protein I